MTPTSHCYIDYYQGSENQEPPGIGGFLPLSKVYAFNPIPEGLDGRAAKHILGGQVNLWTEYVPNLKHAEYMAFPRAAAMAEVLWSPADRRNWTDFSRRILDVMSRYSVMDINYSKSVFQVSANSSFNSAKQKLEVSLTCELPDAQIRYTTDGSEPNDTSQLYTEPILLSQTSTIKAKAFSGLNSSAKVFSQTFTLSKPIDMIP
jgi:hexosaminidase